MSRVPGGVDAFPASAIPRVRIALAILFAAVPLLGVLWGGWDVREVLLLYWAENLVIGFWQVVKMAGAGGAGRAGIPGKLFVIGFFTVHYGAFCAAHGMFINAMSGGADVMGGLMGAARAWGPLALVGLPTKSIASLPVGALWAILGMVLSHGLETWRTFLANGRFREVEARSLMMEPYKRIIVIHVAIVLGGAIAMFLSHGWPVLLLIVLGKLWTDLRSIRKGEGKAA